PGDCVPRGTTEGSNTHKTEIREVHYRWHPWYGRQVVVRGIRHRRGGVALNCRAGDDGASPVLEVPEWMFDFSVCSRVKQAGTAKVDCRELQGLKILLASRFGIELEVQTQHHPVIPGGVDAKESSREGFSSGCSSRPSGVRKCPEKFVRGSCACWRKCCAST